MSASIIVVEDDRDVRENLVALLGSDTRLQLVGEYGSAEEALRAAPSLRPEMAVMDINLPRMSGIDCVARLKAMLPQIQVLILTVYEDGDNVFRALKAGANGYLIKRDVRENLLSALQDIRDGGAPMSSRIARQVVQFFYASDDLSPPVASLSAREREVLELLVAGLIHKEVAEQLGIGLETVRTHVSRIYEKLHVRSRAEAVVKYLRG
jgi:DNA-binding NarL/FixJ family response regulator